MNGVDLTTALARLLSDRELRETFFRDRQRVASILSLSDADVPGFLALDAETLEAQAIGLLDKRFHEVSQLAPETVGKLGAKAATLFREYASGYWPAGHRRHLVDAVRFCECIREANPRKVCQAELNWLRFLDSERRLEVHFVRDLMVDGRPRQAIQVFRRDRQQLPRRMVWCWRW